jgi:hypothetical protein
MGNLPLCVLKDCVESYPDDGPASPIPGDVYTVEELVGHLKAATAGPPRRFNLELPGDIRVHVCLGGPWAAISWHPLFFGPLPPPPLPPAWYARPEQPLADEEVSFLLSSRAGDIPAERLLPPDEVIAMAAYIAEHRALPP